MKSPSVLLILCLSAVVVSSALEQTVGGWTSVKSLDDPHLKEIAEFAVHEYNKQLKASLSLTRVVEAETQIVSGMNYRIVIDVEEGKGGSKRYEAVVWEKPSDHSMKLTSFKPL
ncbi:hypothetical protein MLD38_034548 [Melastoma candidum]|uniref:Uncharacterized protein n=1 Tax=Melastoma candidum TaxID=119954 RepID=A0ACB9MAT2_9MYRT|nr:hypothetical protein MLD38_034548 [Melastoma candidum]